MAQYNMIKNKEDLEEIRYLMAKIETKYTIEDKVIINKLAKKLINNGIRICNFDYFYNNENGLDLDEIINYILKNQLNYKKYVERKENKKIISFTTRKNNIIKKKVR